MNRNHSIAQNSITSSSAGTRPDASAFLTSDKEVFIDGGPSQEMEAGMSLGVGAGAKAEEVVQGVKSTVIRFKGLIGSPLRPREEAVGRGTLSPRIGADGQTWLPANDSGADETDETDETDYPESGETGEELGADGLPVVKMEGGHLPILVKKAQEFLAKTGVYFASGNELVCVRRDPITAEAAIQEVTPARLSVVLSELASWWTVASRSGGWRRVDAPDQLCTKLLKQGDFEGLPPLAGLAPQPFLRADGSIRRNPGYDPLSQLYGAFSGDDFPLAEAPTRTDAQAALNRLLGLISEFPFAAPSDRAAALAALLTAAVRPGLNLAPMFLITAPTPGTGKTFLAEIISVLASSRRSEPIAMPTTEVECEKVLHAALMRRPPVLLFDNLTGDLPAYDKLCSILTAEAAQGRKLGQSQMTSYQTRTTVLATGNNVRPHRDMNRRVVSIRLDLKQESPATREFKNPQLLAEALKNRAALVTDALTIVLAWITAGRPRSKAPELATYTSWSDWCRQPLLWLEQDDPAASVFEQVADDPEQRLLKLLLAQWHASFGEKPTMTRHLIDAASMAHVDNPLREALLEISDQGDTMNPRRIGRWIARHRDRVADGLRLEPARRTGNADAWRVVRV